MGQVLFYCTFAYIVGNGKGLYSSVVYDNFFYAVLLAVGKLVAVQADWGGVFFVVGVAKEKVYTTDCTEGKERNSDVFKKVFCAVGNYEGEFCYFQHKIDDDVNSGSEAIFHQQENKEDG